MATTSEIKAGLDEIAGIIRAQRELMKTVKAQGVGASGTLDAISTTYADVIATIQAFSPSTTDEFEKVSVAEFNKLVAEFTALKAVTDEVANVNLG